MVGAFALVASFLAFLVPLVIPLFAQRWQSLAIIAALGAAFFAYLNRDLGNPTGAAQAIGPFIAGLMLFGFAGGVIAKFVMLLGRR